MIEDLEKLRKEAETEIKAAKAEADLSAVRVKFLGRKGLLTQYLRNLGQLSIEEKQLYGKRANEIKDILASSFEEAQGALAALKREDALRREAIDVTLPGRRSGYGRIHPVTQVLHC
jgi:phenylalanyl-tRNA synthetase alpha chain